MLMTYLAVLLALCAVAQSMNLDAPMLPNQYSYGLLFDGGP
jgi:hypothetical protein